MFRYRQTQHLQKRLEERFGEFLKPFGIGTEEKREHQKQQPKEPQKRTSAKARQTSQPTHTAQQ